MKRQVHAQARMREPSQHEMDERAKHCAQRGESHLQALLELKATFPTLTAEQCCHALIAAYGISLRQMAKLLADNGFSAEQAAPALRKGYPSTTAREMADALTEAYPKLTPAQLDAALKAAGYDIGPSWEPRKDLVTPRESFAVASVGDKLYAIAGQAGRPESVNERYDAASAQWATMARMPYRDGAQNCAAAVLNGRIHVLGGDDGVGGTHPLPLHFVYDPANDTWSAPQSLPLGLEGHGAAVVNGKIYVVGGLGQPTSAFQAINLEYSPGSNTWTRRRDMPTARDGLVAATARGKLYAIGGRGNGDFPFPPLSTNECYDPATDTWTTRAPMPTARAYAAVAVVDEKIYVIGGGRQHPHGFEGLGAVEVYDPATDTWTQSTPLPVPRTFLAATALGDTLHVLGGQASSRPLAIHQALKVR